MLFWQDGSFLGLETQIDPYTISGYILALLAVLLQELRKNMLVGSAESKQKYNLWGLCYYASCPLLAIVVHCIPRVYVIPIVGFCRHATLYYKKSYTLIPVQGYMLTLVAMLLRWSYKFL